MVGNDVVDLSDPDADPATRHPRFDIRAFCSSERKRIADSRDSNALRWHMWAAKEASYKVARKRDEGAVFHPSEFVVSITSRESEEVASVAWGRSIFRVRFEEGDSFVHAIAEPAEEHARAHVSRARRVASPGEPEPSPAELSRAARRFATHQLSAWLGHREDSVEIRSNGKLPEIWVEGERSAVDLSLSHHGRVVAFAANLEDRDAKTLAMTGAPHPGYSEEALS